MTEFIEAAPLTSARVHVREPYRAYGNRIGDLSGHLEAGGIILHSGRNVIRRATISSPDGESVEVAVKAFQVPARPRGFIYAHLRPSKARRSFEHAEKLLELGIGTPDPVAWIEHEEAACLRESCYVCRYWPPDIDLTGLLYRGDCAGPDTDSLLKELARFTLLQHESGVLHLDYNPGNILARAAGAGFEFALVDLNRLRFRPLNRNDRISCLVRLTTSGDYLRSIGRRYADILGEDAERFCRELERARSRFRRRRRTMHRVKSLLRHER